MTPPKRMAGVSKPHLLHKGHGRPHITGEHIDKAKFIKILNDDMARTKKIETDRRVLRSLTDLNTRIRDLEVGDKGKEDDDESTMDLTKKAELYLDRLDEIARKSGNIKGDLTRALKDSALAVKGIVGTLAGHSINDEMRTLRVANQRLQDKVDDLQKQLEELRGRFDSLPTGEDRMPCQPAAVGRTTVRATRNSRRNAPALRQEEEEMEVEAIHIPPAAPTS